MGKRRRHQIPPPAPPPSDVPAGRSRRWPLAAAAAVMAAAVAALLHWGPATAVSRDPGRSVLLISIDTLRADALGAYGRKDAETPWIDRLAQAGVRFDRAHAHNVVTLPSHANILSGRHPYDHGVRDNSGFRFPAGMPTLATVLKGQGYRTGAFVSAFPLSSRFGLDRGFDVYDDRLGGEETRGSFLIAERSGPETVAAAARWLAENAGERTFCFVHLYEPHFPYAPPPAIAVRFPGDAYGGEVAAADAALEPLLRPLLEAAEAGRSLVVLTSDHGESLGEHGEGSHGVFAYEATLRVPLLLYAPGILRPAVVAEEAGHVDVLPTVLDALGVGPPPGLPGRSLLRAAAGARREPPVPLYFEALSTSLNQGWAPLFGVIDGPLKFVDLPLPELYDLEADPREAHNLVAVRPGDVERLRAALRPHRSRDRGTERQAEDRETVERLRALGYVAGAAPSRVAHSEEDDPKRLIALEQRSAEALRHYVAGDVEAALRLTRANIEARPDMALAHLHLAFLERARGNVAGAIASAGRALSLRPGDAETAALLATYLTEAGRHAEALAVVEPLAAREDADLDVLTARGMALSAAGRHHEALATFARARAADPSDANVVVNMGTVHLMAGDRVRARAAFEAALAVDARLARAHNSLGVLAAQEGRKEEALARWRQAAALDARDYQALFNLGTTLRADGREAEARPWLEAYLRVAPVALEASDMARVRGWLAREPSGNRAPPPLVR